MKFCHNCAYFTSGGGPPTNFVRSHLKWFVILQNSALCESILECYLLYIENASENYSLVFCIRNKWTPKNTRRCFTREQLHVWFYPSLLHYAWLLLISFNHQEKLLKAKGHIFLAFACSGLVDILVSFPALLLFHSEAFMKTWYLKCMLSHCFMDPLQSMLCIVYLLAVSILEL